MRYQTKSYLILIGACGLIIGAVELTRTQRAAHYVLLGLVVYFGIFGVLLGLWSIVKHWARKRVLKDAQRRDYERRLADADEYRRNIQAYMSDIEIDEDEDDLN